MKFAKNRLYIEKYIKCPNCGVLIFESSSASADQTMTVDGRLYCSAWCVEWEAERKVRRAAERSATS